jgi:hypothetical protein
VCRTARLSLLQGPECFKIKACDIAMHAIEIDGGHVHVSLSSEALGTSRPRYPLGLRCLRRSRKESSKFFAKRSIQKCNLQLPHRWTVSEPCSQTSLPQCRREIEASNLWLTGVSAVVQCAAACWQVPLAHVRQGARRSKGYGARRRDHWLASCLASCGCEGTHQTPERRAISAEKRWLLLAELTALPSGGCSNSTTSFAGAHRTMGSPLEPLRKSSCSVAKLAADVTSR